MALFSVDMPPIADSKPLHLLSNPILKRAKLLLISALVLHILAVFIVATIIFSATQKAVQSPMEFVESGAQGIDSLAQIGNVLSFLAFIMMSFSFFYLSKLAMRMRLFKLFVAGFVIGLVFNFSRFLLLGAESASIWVMVYGVCAGIVCVIMFYIMWECGRELSFISNEAYFFLSAKCITIGTLIAIFGAIAAVIGVDNVNSILQVIGILVAFAGILMSVVGFIIGTIAIFKLKMIVVYGDSAKNPIV